MFKGLSQSDISISIVSVVDASDSTLITTLGDESVTLVGFTGPLTIGTDLVFV